MRLFVLLLLNISCLLPPCYALQLEPIIPSLGRHLVEQKYVPPQGELRPSKNALLQVPLVKHNEDEWIPDRSRRHVFKSSRIAAVSLLLPLPTLALPTPILSDTTLSTADTTMIDCLSDLPKLDTKKFVRLFLCRHGETENNRLQIVQGARIDAPINENGQRQAMLLGLALLQAPEPPEVFFHSPMIRAQQTAEIAARQYRTVSSSRLPPLIALSSLKELDFGATIEQTRVDEMRAQRVAIYTAWAMGRLDARMSEDGESANDVSV
jgi:Histidine phosphatase superfamily (branch 1)